MSEQKHLIYAKSEDKTLSYSQAALRDAQRSMDTYFRRTE